MTEPWDVWSARPMRERWLLLKELADFLSPDDDPRGVDSPKGVAPSLTDLMD